MCVQMNHAVELNNTEVLLALPVNSYLDPTRLISQFVFLLSFYEGKKTAESVENLHARQYHN